MQSTLTAREADPHDMFVIEPDVVLAARADPPGTDKREPDLRALVSEISAGVAAQTAAPKVDTSFRAVNIPKKRGRWASSFIVAFLFALLSAVGAAAWQRYGDRAQAYVAAVLPMLDFSSSQAAAPPAPDSAPAVAAAATDPATPAAPAAAAPPADDSTAASAPAAIDQTQVIASLTRDLAAMGKQVETLKATIAELKAGQDQLTRDVRASEAKALEHAKVTALPPRPPAPPVRRPRPYVPPVQTSVAPPLPPPGAPGSAPVQIAPAPPPPPPVAAGPQDEPVIRPPMPVR